MTKYVVSLNNESHLETISSEVEADDAKSAVKIAVSVLAKTDKPWSVQVKDESGAEVLNTTAELSVKTKLPRKKTTRGKRKLGVYDEQHERETYDADFYEAHRQYSQKGAPFFAKFIKDHFGKDGVVKSICDLGCGTGIFITDFLKDADVVRGVDFSVGATKTLDIPVENYVDADLTKPLPFKEHFDVVVSIEVWEHLMSQFEAQYIENVMSLTPNYLVISCAPPHQWGRHHYSPHEPAYMRELIESKGYEFLPELTEQFCGDKSKGIKGIKYLASFYRKNTMLFKKKGYTPLPNWGQSGSAI